MGYHQMSMMNACSANLPPSNERGGQERHPIKGNHCGMPVPGINFDQTTLPNAGFDDIDWPACLPSYLGWDRVISLPVLAISASHHIC